MILLKWKIMRKTNENRKLQWHIQLELNSTQHTHAVKSEQNQIMIL